MKATATKSMIMRRAWEIYRTLEGNRLGKLSYALKQAWAEAKAAATILKNVTVKAYAPFNERRYSDPWVAVIGSDGMPDFSKRVGEYTGGYRTGDSGELIIYKPVSSTVYMYGQRDYRGSHTEKAYIIFENGTFREISRKEVLDIINK